MVVDAVDERPVEIEEKSDCPLIIGESAASKVGSPDTSSAKPNGM